MPYLKTEAYQDPMPSSSIMRRAWFVVAVVVVVAAVGGLGIWRLTSFRSVAQAAPLTPKGVPQILDRIGRLILLPSDETPLIGTVTDARSLSVDQPFFADAHTGDVVVVYERHARALVYRPSRDILINVGPTYVGITAVATPQAETPRVPITAPVNHEEGAPSTSVNASPLKLDIRNGSRTSGKATQLAKTFFAEKTYYDVISVVPAGRKEYEGTTLVVLQNSSSPYLELLKSKLGKIQVTTTLMHGEKSSAADVVIVLGN